MTRTVTAATLWLLLSLGANGCSLFNHSSQSQQFMDALDRNNGAQASQIWLKMSAKDRANFEHSVGLKPDVNKEDIGRQLLKHQQEKEAAKNADEPDPMMSTINSNKAEGGT